MKKAVCAILMFLLAFPALAFADVDLDGMSFDQLVELRERVDLAIWKSDGWQEVEVPKGVYEVGKDIPEGKWTIRAAEETAAKIYWGDELDVSGVELSYDGDIWELERIVSPEYRYYEKGDTTEVTYAMKNGQYFIVDDGIAVFTPYAGTPSLGFK